MLRMDACSFCKSFKFTQIATVDSSAQLTVGYYIASLKDQCSSAHNNLLVCMIIAVILRRTYRLYTIEST